LAEKIVIYRIRWYIEKIGGS